MLGSVLVTGGGSGIGGELAVELARRGCRVIVSGRRTELLDHVASSSELVSTCSGDVTDPADRSAVIAALGASAGPRAIVHAAGYFQTGMLDALSTDDWRRSFDVNVESRWELSREALPILAGGRVLFIGSDAGGAPRVGAAAYSIAQAASETLRRALQAEWAETSISVGAFKPGLVDTEMVRGFMRLSAEEFPARAAYEDYFASGQVATPHTIARFAAWLLLDVSSERFTNNEWDIRDELHHHEWAE